MRLFEIILILVNLISLLLTFKKHHKLIYSGIIIVNVSIFLAHIVFEGWRYQMTFSYILVTLAIFYALGKLTVSFSFQIPKTVKRITLSICFLLLALSGFLAYTLPVFALPDVSGSHSVGFTYFHFVDESRDEPFIADSMLSRELMVKVYYPALDNKKEPYSAYFNGSAGLLTQFAKFYGLPDFFFSHLALVRTYTKENLPISDQQQNYPVILLSHGAGTSMEVQTSLATELASHGYIVATIDHPYVSAATIFPNRIVSAREATVNFDVSEPAVPITQIMADDASFVIDMLEDLNTGATSSIFQRRLDLNRIGIIGHSVGGAVAYNLAINEPRIKAAINIDGVVYITPSANTEIAPFLMLANDQGHIQSIQNREPLMQNLEEMTEWDQEQTLSIYGSREAYQTTYDEALRNVIGLTSVLESSNDLFTIEGCDHMKFIDIGLFFGLKQIRELMQISGNTDPLQCMETTNALAVAYFDQYLKGESEEILMDLIINDIKLDRVVLSNASE